MSDLHKPSRWRATWTQIERQTVHFEDHPDFDPRDTKAWSEKMKKRFPFNNKMVPGMVALIFLMGGSVLFQVCTNHVNKDSLLQQLLPYSFFILIGLWTFLSPNLAKLWPLAHRFAHSLRLVDRQAQWCDTDLTFTLPVELGMSWEPEPKIYWRASQQPQSVQSSEPLPQHALDGLRAQAVLEGALEIEQGKFAAELSVHPENEQDLCLELRSVRDKTRLHIALSPSDLPDTYQRRALPKIERHGMVMPSKDRQEFLQQLSLAAQLEGVSVPVLVQEQAVAR